MVIFICPVENREFLYKQPKTPIETDTFFFGSGTTSGVLLSTQCLYYRPGTAQLSMAERNIWAYVMICMRCLNTCEACFHSLSGAVGGPQQSCSLMMSGKCVNEHYLKLYSGPESPAKWRARWGVGTCVACTRGPVGHSRGHAVPLEGGVGQRQQVGVAQGCSWVAVDQAVGVAHRDWDGHVVIRLGDGL